MRIAVACDHGGFVQKDAVIEHLKSLGHEVTDLGTNSEESVDYPDYADRAARMVSRGEADRAILICGTGIGMAITADKVPGVRATPVQTVKFAELARQHNNANVIALSGRFVSLEDNLVLVDTFLNTEFEGGRHAKRVEKIMREDDPAFPGVDA
ncbi:MAG: ribose 5-phosphate isomerase B [Atopobiaceae bacterium]|uniref:ribose 5-phosphate isomerase B n=1 Tax=Paratractidigestivibacter sp. TaxID=2847316 RepID=UPI000D79C1B5|nr:ribose 5-phosphate isomerase B [Atopobiaceae bacterium]PWM32647.1 MAG: ribose 5-phosphate isomerase B [Coriobacteriia bacterium]